MKKPIPTNLVVDFSIMFEAYWKSSPAIQVIVQEMVEIINTKDIREDTKFAAVDTVIEALYF